MLSSSEVFQRVYDVLPEPKFAGKLDGLPEEHATAFVVLPGDAPLSDESTMLTLDPGERLLREEIFIEIRIRTHRDDWLFRLMDFRDEVIRQVAALKIPSFSFQGVDEPVTATGDLDYIELRLKYLHIFSI